MIKAGKFISKAVCGAVAAALGFYYAFLPIDLCAKAALSIGENAPAETDTFNERKMLIPGGEPFGIKLRMDGVMVVSVNDNSPADKAGICAGDIIFEVNGTPVSSNADISRAIQLDAGTSRIILSRSSRELCINVTPAEENGIMRIGAWVRDSSAGIGTMTFYDPDDGSFGGLGHAVSDATTGELMPLSSGEITGAEIYGAVKGESGETGELCGELLRNVRGTLTLNTSVGVFGTLSEIPKGAAIPTAYKQEVKCGEAVLLTTLSGSEPAEYAIEIEKINPFASSGTKGMVIRITDEELLEQTGGIVRGMSGSPIIQNGMLVGAVTHVFLSDPTRGYAVFAENMLSAAEAESG